MGTTISSVHGKTVIETNGYLDVGEYELNLWDSRYMLRDERDKDGESQRYFKPSCLLVFAVAIMISLVALLPLMRKAPSSDHAIDCLSVVKDCKTCKFSNMENFIGRTNNNSKNRRKSALFDVWIELIRKSRKSVKILSSNLNFNENNSDPYQIKLLHDTLKTALMKRDVVVTIILDVMDKSAIDEDELMTMRTLGVNLLEIFTKTGSQNLEFWIVDDTMMIVEGASLTWSTLFDPNTFGLMIHDCQCMVEEFSDLFSNLQDDILNLKKPDSSQKRIEKNYFNGIFLNVSDSDIHLHRKFNSMDKCFNLKFDDMIHSIINFIDEAENFMFLVINEYMPLIMGPQSLRMWSIIDEHLRQAAFIHKVDVRILVYDIDSSKPETLAFLRSLNVLKSANTSLSVKYVNLLPSSRRKYYLITDKAFVYGFGNWSGDILKDDRNIPFSIVEKNYLKNSTNWLNLYTDFIKIWKSPKSKIIQ